MESVEQFRCVNKYNKISFVFLNLSLIVLAKILRTTVKKNLESGTSIAFWILEKMLHCFAI